MAAAVVLPNQKTHGATGAAGVGEPRLTDQRRAPVGQMRRKREPLLMCGLVQCRKAGPVLMVAPGELDVAENDPPVGGVQLGQRGQPRKQVRLVDRAHPARRPDAR